MPRELFGRKHTVDGALGNECGDILQPLVPDALTGQGRRQLLPGQHLRMDPRHQHFLVPATVMDADMAAPRQRLRGRRGQAPAQARRQRRVGARQQRPQPVSVERPRAFLDFGVECAGSLAPARHLRQLLRRRAASPRRPLRAMPPPVTRPIWAATSWITTISGKLKMKVQARP